MKINVRKPSNFRSGKGPMDGIGTASKISFFRTVFSREVKISNPKKFGEYVNHISGVHSLYLLTDQIPPVLDEVANATSVPDTLKTHGIVRGLSKHEIPYLKFFFLIMITNHTTRNGMDQNVVTLTILSTRTLVHFVYESITSGLTWNECNVQFVKAGWMKTAFSVDMYIHCLFETEDVRFNLIKFSEKTANSVGWNFSCLSFL